MFRVVLHHWKRINIYWKPTVHCAFSLALSPFFSIINPSSNPISGAPDWLVGGRLGQGRLSGESGPYVDSWMRSSGQPRGRKKRGALQARAWNHCGQRHQSKRECGQVKGLQEPGDGESKLRSRQELDCKGSCKPCEDAWPSSWRTWRTNELFKGGRMKRDIIIFCL